MSDQVYVEQLMDWLLRVVIGENLCPFAKPSVDAGRFDLRISRAKNIDRAYQDTLSYLEWFLEPEAEHLDSALIAFSMALEDFDEYLDCLSALELALEELELEGVIQLASFHPHYLFEGTVVDDPAHWTNRSPLPAIHLLREERVSNALELVRDPEKIPERNIDHLRSLSADQLSKLFSGLQ